MTDQKQIEKALGLLFQPGDTIELRCVGDGPVVSGYFRDPERAAAAAATLNSEGNRNVYFCLNPIKPVLYDQRPDRTATVGKNEAVKDRDVTCRRWLLIDVDPDRPKDTSATDEESAAAETVAGEVYRYLEQAGLPKPVVTLSGNGRHLLLPLADWPNDAKSTRACKKFLQHLSDRFSNERANVDISTANAARIAALPGTVKRKGQATTDRPHRLAELLDVPDLIRRATIEQIEALIEPQPDQQPKQQQQPSAGAWNVQQLLDERGVACERDEEFEADDGTRAVRYVLPVCPFNPAHDNSSAVLLEWPSGAVSFTCHHNSCQGNDWQALMRLWGLGGVTASDIIVSSQSNSQLGVLEDFIEPPVCNSTAFYGPIGEICQGLAEHTEAAPITILSCAMMLFGNLLGRRFYVQLDQPHFPKLYVCLVGATGSGRKGTADHQARAIIDAIDPTAMIYRHGGLSTGEGMLAVLKDHSDGNYPRPAVFIEREFASVFRRAERKGNTLIAYIRDAWDNDPLENNSKGSPIRVEEHHISIAAHITPTELNKLMRDVEVSNGFANRFLWIYSRRTARRPEARGFQPEDFSRQLAHLRATVEQIKQQSAGQPRLIPFSSEALTFWREQLYPQLDLDSEDDLKLIMMCNRQPQYVCRLALIHAVASGQYEINVDHLRASTALIEYVWSSVDYMLSRAWWGDSSNARDPAGMANRVLAELWKGPMSRSDINDRLFHRHRLARELNELRDAMIQRGQIGVKQQGRTETWTAL